VALQRPVQRGAAASLALVLLAAACGDDSSDSGGGTTGGGDGDRLQVVTTVAPLTNIVANVAGDHADITGVIPDGADSHTYEPPASVARTLSEADVIFVNGLDLEISIADLAEANATDAAFVALGEETLGPDEYIYDFSFPEEAGHPNPHLWTNPLMGRTYAEIVRDTLSELDPENAAAYDENFDALAERIADLDRAMTTATDTVDADRRKLLTYHDGYPYFAEEYGWEVVGAVQPSHFGEPTAAEVADLINQIRGEDVPAIFGSEVFPSPVMEQIADDTGVEYHDDLSDDELPGEVGEPDRSWLEMLRLNFVLKNSGMHSCRSSTTFAPVSFGIAEAKTRVSGIELT
jgi:ABC-type Zn uptake system ZnuABC Zn-binding protein ZnuA